MDFDPRNPVVQLCIRGITAEEKGDADEARQFFRQAWDQADVTDEDLERFLAAFYLARHQDHASDELEWNLRALHYAKKMDDPAMKAAFPPLYAIIARCYQEIGDPERANEFYDLSASSTEGPSEAGPFYHGTRAALVTGDLLTPGGNSNYQPDLVMNHVYFTALPNGAGLAAALAKGDGPERVYVVEPTGPFENDPNVTNKKFPGNLTRSYRSLAPLRIVGEVTDWAKQSSDDLQEWREKLATSKGEIIN